MRRTRSDQSCAHSSQEAPREQPQQMPLLWPYFGSVSMAWEAVARVTGWPPRDQPALSIFVSIHEELGSGSSLGAVRGHDLQNIL